MSSVWRGQICSRRTPGKTSLEETFYEAFFLLLTKDSAEISKRLCLSPAWLARRHEKRQHLGIDVSVN